MTFKQKENIKPKPSSETPAMALASINQDIHESKRKEKTQMKEGFDENVSNWREVEMQQGKEKFPALRNTTRTFKQKPNIKPKPSLRSERIHSRTHMTYATVASEPHSSSSLLMFVSRKLSKGSFRQRSATILFRMEEQDDLSIFSLTLVNSLK